MRPLVTVEARACPLPLSNVDTDQLIPARFMGHSRAQGYGAFLLHDLRYRSDGALDPSFPLNEPRRAKAEILVTHRNFGGGSSREAAIYALVDYGIRVVIASSFGDIFSSNSVKNGLLPARVDEDATRLLTSALESAVDILAVDLPSQTIRCDQTTIDFTIEPIWKEQLLNGWDDIDLTLREAAAIGAFRARDERDRPWATPFRSG